MRERAVEQKLVSRVRKMGGMAIKLAPTIVGLPDRLILLPGGRVFFVEVKEDHGRVTAIQSAMHRRLDTLGFPVSVVYGADDVAELCDTMREEA